MRTLTASRLVIAAAGVLVGHAFAYALPHTDGHAHDAVHAYLHLATPLLMPLALAAMLRLAAAEARRPGGLRLPGLIGLQAALFCVQEAGERIAVDGSLTALVADPALWSGLAAQAVVAVLVSATVRLTGRALREFASRVPVGRAIPAVGFLAVASALRPAAVPVVTQPLRGPPVRA